MAAFRLSMALLAMIVGDNAHAEVKQSAADSFLVTFSEPITATPAKAWTGIAQVQHWWSSEHTWSGKAENLSLKAEAGGCFCERWPGGSVEHGHVIMALPDKLLRLDSALGPLQEFALKGILNFWIRSGDDGATRLDVEYRVNGAGSSGLDAFAPKVDEVLGAQVARLVRYIDTGNPEAPTAPANTDAQAASRATILEEWKKSAEQSNADASKASAPPHRPVTKKKPPKPDSPATP
ncbi:hypothetical protein [Dokdonella soli]|uniref:SRPBCC domain-containing protein n=1 Tax=Dokdonella soli TaxID=529810 RepID=A0ABN1IES1_9GAMM